MTPSNEEGVVTSFDETYIIVKFISEEKKYRWDVAFISKSLSFIDKELNKTIYVELLRREGIRNAKEDALKEIKKEAIAKVKHINELYEKLSLKNEMMKCLFGSDFLYPPYVNFKKKYKGMITEHKGGNYKSYYY